MTAKMLERVLQEKSHSFKPTFTLGLGDSFYPDGIIGREDPRFDTIFSEPFSFLDIPWYNILGNHEYYNNWTEVVIDGTLGKRDERWICHRDYDILKFSPSAINPFSVQFFFIDTNPFLKYYQHSVNECLDKAIPASEDSCDGKYIGLKELEPAMQIKLMSNSILQNGAVSNDTKDAMWDAYTNRMALRLEESLRHSDARVKIVVGHHPVYNQGEHGDTEELKTAFLPILKKYKVPLYINGHSHNLQHIKLNDHPTHFITSGAGAKTDPIPDHAFSVRNSTLIDGVEPQKVSAAWFGGFNGFSLFTIKRVEGDITIEMEHIKSETGLCAYILTISV